MDSISLAARRMPDLAADLAAGDSAGQNGRKGETGPVWPKAPVWVTKW